MSTPAWIALALVAAFVVLGLYDLTQRHHALLRTYPLLGRARFMLEKIGPELRQYWFTDDKSERPFDRTQRDWVYESAKRETNTFGFGTESELETSPNYLIIRHAPFPHPGPERGHPGGPPRFEMPCGKVIGEHRGRTGAFRPRSAINISGMSFGSLSGPAVEAINRGVKLAGCLHNTGEGSLSDYHRNGGELIVQIGTAYFGCRDEQGDFSLSELKKTIAKGPVRALELKLSQGAKPGLGGLLPAAKVSEEIARVRDVEPGRDCVSPPGHKEFNDVDGMLDFVEMLAAETGLPVGIKSAVGDSGFWAELAEEMAGGERGVDFVTIDGGEGGTGAAPLAFSDHVSLPFKLGFSHAYSAFAREGIADRVVFIGSGKLGFPEAALFAFALGCDMVNVGREAMLAIGCIQARICHTDRCPVGITTHKRWLQRGIRPDDKAARLANYVTALRGELYSLSRACGVPHPSLIDPHHLAILDERFCETSVSELFGYDDGWERPSRAEVERLLADMDLGDSAELEAEEAVTPYPEAGWRTATRRR